MEKVYIKNKQGDKVLPITHVSAVLDDQGNDVGSIMGTFEDEVRGLVDTPHQNYVTVSATSSTTSATSALPASGQSADTIYRVANWDGSTNSGAGSFDVTKYSEYAWDDVSAPAKYVFLCVKSQIDQVFDITVYNNNTSYADLATALGTNGSNVPESLRRGGMSVKYVQSFDHKYVKYMYLGTSTAVDDFTNTANWQGVDDIPIFGSHNLVDGNGVRESTYSVERKLLDIKLELFSVKNKTLKQYDATKTGYVANDGSIQRETDQEWTIEIFEGDGITPLIIQGRLMTSNVGLATYHDAELTLLSRILQKGSDSRDVDLYVILDTDEYLAVSTYSGQLGTSHPNTYTFDWDEKLKEALIPKLEELEGDIDALGIKIDNNVIPVNNAVPNNQYKLFDVNSKALVTADSTKTGYVANDGSIQRETDQEWTIEIFEGDGKTPLLIQGRLMTNAVAVAVYNDSALTSLSYVLQKGSDSRDLDRIVVPLDGQYLAVSTYSGQFGTSHPNVYTFQWNDKLRESILPLVTEELNVFLPDKIYATVGDTLQLFFTGMIQAVDIEKYNILISCSKGNQFHRYFEYTPTATDVGQTTFTIRIYDNNHNLLATKTSTLITVGEPISPSNNINIACFGDSLTSDGGWCYEAFRRLTGTGGTPSGKQLGNISFVGNKTIGTAHYCGYPGWNWKSYITAGKLSFRFVLSGTPNVSMGNVYSNNGHQYKVVEINEGTILADVIQEGSIQPTRENEAYYEPETSGNLTLVSGSGDSQVAYTSNTVDSKNPLWDDMNNKFSFIPYAQEYCNGSIDVVYVFLTWNDMTNWKSDFSDFKGYLSTFADTLHAEFPSAKLKVMAVQMPSMRLMMPNYGASGSGYADTYGMLVSAFNQNKAYQEWCNLAGYSSWCEFVSIAPQFDADYGNACILKDVNTRCSIQEYVGRNGVHPRSEGYMQIADAVYRNIVANFCQ